MDQAALSPPEGYKDGGSLQAALGGALGGHVFGAQHIQQLQVIQRLQAQRAAMLAAARASTNQPPANANAPGINQTGEHQSSATAAGSTVCTECVECAECAAKEGKPNGK